MVYVGVWGCGICGCVGMCVCGYDVCTWVWGYVGVCVVVGGCDCVVVWVCDYVCGYV